MGEVLGPETIEREVRRRKHRTLAGIWKFWRRPTRRHPARAMEAAASLETNGVLASAGALMVGHLHPRGTKVHGSAASPIPALHRPRRWCPLPCLVLSCALVLVLVLEARAGRLGTLPVAVAVQQHVPGIPVIRAPSLFRFRLAAPSDCRFRVGSRFVNPKRGSGACFGLLLIIVCWTFCAPVRAVSLAHVSWKSSSSPPLNICSDRQPLTGWIFDTCLR